jgi:hypothetical protein
MAQLMLIAVNVDDGTIQPTVVGNDGNVTLDPTNAPRVVACLNSEDFDKWVAEELNAKKMQLPSVHNSYQHLYTGDNPPAHVGVILFTHHSPGQVCFDFHGVLVCVP